jgi:hypothetical protein
LTLHKLSVILLLTIEKGNSMSKIKTDGNQAFNVPNTEEGKAFIKALRKFSNPKSKNEFVARGRGSRKEYAKKAGRFNAQCSVSHEFAEWFAVYMNGNSNSLKMQNYHLTSCLNVMKQEVERLTQLQKEVDNLKSDREFWKKHYDAALNKVVQAKDEVARLQEEVNALKGEVVALKGDRGFWKNQYDEKVLQLMRQKNALNEVVQVKVDEKKKVPVPVPVPTTIDFTITVPMGTKVNVIEK